MISKQLGWVAVVLAVGIATAINAITIAILVDALKDPAHNGISENAVQILTSSFTGVFGVLGAYVGYRAANGAKTTPPDEPYDPSSETTAVYPPP